MWHCVYRYIIANVTEVLAASFFRVIREYFNLPLPLLQQLAIECSLLFSYREYDWLSHDLPAVIFLLAGPSVRAVYGVGLRPLTF
jgi:hypothetical protein